MIDIVSLKPQNIKNCFLFYFTSFVYLTADLIFCGTTCDSNTLFIFYFYRYHFHGIDMLYRQIIIIFLLNHRLLNQRYVSEKKGKKRKYQCGPCFVKCILYTIFSRRDHFFILQTGD